MNQKYIQEYKKRLYKQSLDEINTKLDIKGERIKLFIQLLIGAILTGLVFAFSYFQIANYENFKDAVYTAIWIGTITPAVIIFIGTRLGARIMARSSGNIFRVAAKQHYDQARALEALSSNNNKIFVEKFNYYDQEHPTTFKTGITVQNKNPIPFTNVAIELIETAWRKLDQDGNVFLTEKIGVLADNSHFKNWANGDIHSIGANDKETIYFHQIEKGIAVALLENRKESFKYKKYSADGKAIGFIEIVFDVRGEVGNEQFEKRYSQLIEYRSTKIKNNPNDLLARMSTIDCHSMLICENEILEIAKPSLV
jgi:hypothetical protein